MKNNKSRKIIILNESIYQTINSLQQQKVHNNLISFCLVLEFIGFILPIFTMIEPHSDFFKAYHKALLTFYTHLFAISTQIYQVFTLLHLLITLCIPIFFLIPKQILNKIALIVLYMYFFVSPFVLPLSAQLLFDSEFDAFDGLSILTILLGLVLCTCFGVVRTSYSCRGINSALIIPCEAKNLADLLARFLLIFVPYIILSDSTLYRLSFTGLLLVLSLFEVYLLLTRYLYYRESVETAMHLSCCVKSAVSLLAFILFATQQKLLLNNLLVVVCSTSIFSFLSVQRYKAYTFEEIELKEPNAIQSQQQALIFIYSNMRTFLKEGSDAYNKMQLNTTSFKFQHLPNCSDPSCFCKNSKSQHLQSQIQFLKLKQMWHKYSQSSQVSACIVYVLIEQFKKYTLTLNRLSKLKLKKDSIYAQILQVKCERQLANILAFNNKQTSTIETTKILEAEQLTQTVKQKQIALISKKADLWQKLQRGVSSPADLHKNINEQIKLKRSMSELGRTAIEQHKECSQLLDMFLKYYKLIELRPKAPLWLKQALKRLYNGLQKSRISFKKGCFTDQDLTAQMYSSRACLLQSEINADCMGIIANASKNVKDIFGYDQQSIRGVQINRLMSPSMQRQHDKLLANWIENSSWSKMGHPRTIYALRKKQVCFEAVIYLSVIQKVDCLSVAVALFMLNDRDFMLINKEGTIDGAGTYFLESLGSKIIGLPLKQICRQADQITLSKNKQKRVYSFLVKKDDAYHDISPSNNVKAFKFESQKIKISVLVSQYQFGNSKNFILKYFPNENLYCKQQTAKYVKNMTFKNYDNASQNIQFNSEEVNSVTSVTNLKDLSIINLCQRLEFLSTNPQQIKLPNYNKFLIYFLLISFIGLGITLFLIFFRLQSYNKQMLIFNITHQQKSLVQEVESLYDQTLTFLLQPQKFQVIQQANKIQIQKLNKQIVAAAYTFLKERQGPLKQPIQQIQNFPNITLDNQQIVKLKPYDFLVRFVFSLKQLNNRYSGQTPSSIKKGAQFSARNYLNLSQMKKQIIQIYLKFGRKQEQQRLRIVFYVVFLYLILVLTNIGLKWYLKRQSLQTKNKIICLLGLVHKCNCKVLSQYYKSTYQPRELEDYTNLTAKLLKRNKNLSFHQKRQDSKRINKQHNDILKSLLQFIPNLIFAAVISSIIFFQENYYQRLNTVRDNLQNLMLSQYQIIDTLCQLKGFAFHSPYQFDKQLGKSLQKRLKNNTQTIFDSLTVLNNMFVESQINNFKTYTHLLETDMCDFLSQYGIQNLNYCYQSRDYQLYKQGFLITLNSISKNLAITTSKIKYQKIVYKPGKYDQFFMTTTGAKYLSLYFEVMQKVILKNIQVFVQKYKDGQLKYVQAYSLVIILLGFISIYLWLKKLPLNAQYNMEMILTIPFDIINSTNGMSKDIRNIIDF